MTVFLLLVVCLFTNMSLFAQSGQSDMTFFVQPLHIKDHKAAEVGAVTNHIHVSFFFFKSKAVARTISLTARSFSGQERSARADLCFLVFLILVAKQMCVSFHQCSFCRILGRELNK